jgi:hypothetical protein
LTGMPCDGHFVRHKAVARSRNLLLDSPSYEPKGYRQNVGGGRAIYAGVDNFAIFCNRKVPASWMEAASDAWGRKTSTGELPAWAKRAQKPTFSRQRSPTAGFSRANSGSGDTGMIAQLHLNAHERALAMLLLSRTSTGLCSSSSLLVWVDLVLVRSFVVWGNAFLVLKSLSLLTIFVRSLLHPSALFDSVDVLIKPIPPRTPPSPTTRFTHLPMSIRSRAS